MRFLWRLPGHWYFLLQATVRLAVWFARAALFFQNQASRKFSEQHTRLNAARHRHYFFGSVYLGAVFGALRGCALSREELHRFSDLAALAGFFDDLTDGVGERDNFPENNIEAFGRKADPDGLTLFFLKKTRAVLPQVNAGQFQQALERVFQIEVAEKPSLQPLEDIIRRTAEKGGQSVLLFRCLLDAPIADAERRALLEFGHLVQLCDDIFDLWHDQQSRSETVATVCATQHELEKLSAFFERQVHAVTAAVRQVSAPGHHRETALRMICFLTAITRVCLHHYRRLQKKHGTLPLADRRAMVVDMDKWTTRCRVVSALFIAHHSSLHKT